MWWKNASKKCLRKDIFEKYYQLLQSPSPRTEIIALQKLNELLRDGYVLLPDDGAKLDACLLKLLCEGGIGNANAEAIRRCAYRVCAKRFNPEIYDLCRKLLAEETCADNKMAIISVLVQNVSLEQFNRSIPFLEDCSGLSRQQIRLAEFASTRLNIQLLEKELIYGFLDTNDITALRFLPIVFNERNFCGESNTLNSKLFGELTNHDDPWIQKYSLGTFSKMRRFCVEDLKIDPSKFLSLNAQPQKWVMTDIFLDRKFVRNNQDLVRYILSEHHLFTECDNRIKEGIAQGMLRYGYNAEWDQYIISWYTQEKDPSIKMLLRSYMMASERKNKEFGYILEDERKNRNRYTEKGRLYLPGYIQKGKPFFLFGVENRVSKIRKSQKKEAFFMINNSFNKNQIGFVGGDYVGGDINNLASSIDNSILELQEKIDSQGGPNAEELKEILEEVKELIENIEATRMIPKRKQLFKKISDHASKHGWFYGELVSLLGQRFIEMLGN